MGLFKSKAEKELDAIIQRLNMNMSNNYKDNAQDDLKEFEATINGLKTSGGIKASTLAKYEGMRWGRGANNLAKVMYRKENRELIDTIDRYTDGLVTTMYLNEIVEELSAAKSPKKDGKGNPYLDCWYNHMPLLDAMRTASRKAFIRAFVDG